jgi:hypothetical protein
VESARYDTFWNATPGEVDPRETTHRKRGSERNRIPSCRNRRTQAAAAHHPRVGRTAATVDRLEPAGVYESSDNVERLLGGTSTRDGEARWHCRATQYREPYYRKGLIDAARSRQTPEGQQANRPLPRPVLGLLVE